MLSLIDREDDEDEAEHRDLHPGVALLGVDELRQEGEEEERRLRVEHVHDHALAEPAAEAPLAGQRSPAARRAA